MRAYQYSVDFNKGKVYLVLNPDGSRPDWHKAFKDEHKNFPVGTTKDIVDAGSDAHKYLTDLYYRGLVIKNFNPHINLVGWSKFATRFNGQIPAHWEVSAALRVEADASKPSGWAIVARAAEDAKLGEIVFVVASARRFVSDPPSLLLELKSALRRYCAGSADTIWLGRESADIVQVAGEKYGLDLSEFSDEAGAGVAEANWYFQAFGGAQHPFYSRAGASRCYVLVDDLQIGSPKNEDGQLSLRQDATSWSYTEQGEPQRYGGVVLDCVRMNLYNFALSATPMTREQRQLSQLPDDLQPTAVMSHLGEPEFVDRYTAQKHALTRIRLKEEKEEKETNKRWAQFTARPASHRRYRKT